MTTEADHVKKIQAMAKAIKTKASGAGFVVLLKDQENRAHLVPGHSVEVIAIYDDRVRTPWIRDDLIDAGIER